MGKHDKRWKRRIYPEEIYPDEKINRLLMEAEEKNLSDIPIKEDILDIDEDDDHIEVYQHRDMSCLPKNFDYPALTNLDRMVAKEIMSLLSMARLNFVIIDATHRMSVGFRNVNVLINMSHLIAAKYTSQRYDLIQGIVIQNIGTLINCVLNTFIDEFVKPMQVLTVYNEFEKFINIAGTAKWCEFIDNLRNLTKDPLEDFITAIIIMISSHDVIEADLIPAFSKEFIDPIVKQYIPIRPISI